MKKHCLTGILSMLSTHLAIIGKCDDHIIDEPRIMSTIIHFEAICIIKEVVFNVVIAASIIIIDPLRTTIIGLNCQQKIAS